MRTRTALLPLALAALTVAAVAPAATAAPAGSTVIVDCAGKKVTKPTEIDVACADAGITVQGITWSTWNANTARGRGTLVWNTCLPKDCAGGIVQKYKARIVLDRVASGPGVTVFSRMRLDFGDAGGPAGLDTGTLTLPNAGA